MYVKGTMGKIFNAKISHYFLISIILSSQLVAVNLFIITKKDFLKGGIKLGGEILP